MVEPEQAILDREHLRLLAIGYYVSAGMNLFFSLFGLMYAFMGAFFQAMIPKLPQAPSGQAAPPPPEIFGMVFGIFGCGIFVVMVALAILKFVVARRLTQRRSRGFCMVVAALCCFGVPWGTVLGVFTFVVLSRPSVVASFD